MAWPSGSAALACAEQEREITMEMSDSRVIKADRATVWAALLSPEVLKECVPGAQEVTGTPEDGFEATVTQKVGPVKATFKGQVTLSDMVEPDSLTLSGEGKGGGHCCPMRSRPRWAASWRNWAAA